MENKYLTELQKLGFTGDVNPSRPILATRAYRNISFPGYNDSSYAVLYMPTCYDKETENDLFVKIIEVLRIVYIISVLGLKYSKEELPPITTKYGLLFQFEYKCALSKQEIVSKFLEMLNMARDTLEKSMSSHPEKKSVCESIIQRLNVIRVFIEAGYVSYEYNERDYDVFD